MISIKLLCNFIKITLWHGWSPVNLLHFSRTPFTKKTWLAASEPSGILKLNVNIDKLCESWFRNIEQKNFNQYFNEIWNIKVYHRRNKYLIIFFSSIFKLSRINVLNFYVVFLHSNFTTLQNKLLWRCS